MAPKAVLIGLPGSGKSTIGRRLSKALGLTFLDTDAEIERRTGRTIAEIFGTDGEPGFRRIEEEVIRAALHDHEGILSLGGGAVTADGVRDALAGHTVIYLEISAAEGVRRTSGGTVRPLLAGPDRAEKFRTLMSERVPLYRRVATIRINTNRRNPGAVVRNIIGLLEDSRQQQSRGRRPPWRRAAVTPRAATPAPRAATPAPPAASAPAAGAAAAATDPGPVTPATLARRAGVRK
jgi:shikimate kinase